MKIELQSGDRITISKGCKATINGNEVVVEKEEKEFKRGDVIVSKIDEILLVATYDFDSNLLTSFVNIDAHGNLFNNPYQKWSVSHDWRLATEEEKKLLFDKMKEQGLRWNAKEKRVEKIRWRAEEGDEYFAIDTAIQVCNLFEDNGACDNAFYDALNYFHTKEQAEEAAKRVKETLRNYHEEIGE